MRTRRGQPPSGNFTVWPSLVSLDKVIRRHTGPHWLAQVGDAHVAFLCAGGFCCIMGHVWAVNGGQQM